jgi:hypothetical protein
MTTKLRKLYVLVVDNDDASVAGILDQCLGSEAYSKEYALSYENALEFLNLRKGLAKGREYLPYDLILFDLHLGNEHKYGGTQLLAEYWAAIRESGAKSLVFSGKVDEFVEPYLPFMTPGGPFLFTKKIPADELAEKILILLRERVKELCYRAPLGAAHDLIKGNSRRVWIDGEPWSVNSLISPWLFREGELRKTRQTREALIRILFPDDDLVRIFSYWFKARAFLWDSDQMYGLSPLDDYHCGDPTGPMDALLHAPEDSERVMFADAARAAKSDLELLRAGLHPDFVKEVEDYIKKAERWKSGEQIDEQAAEHLKAKVMFTLSRVCNVFEKTAGVKLLTFDGYQDISACEFYCPAYYSGGSAKPAVIHALERLWSSISKRSNVKKSGKCEVALEFEGDLIRRRQEPGSFPYFTITIRHDGPECKEGSISSWFPERHRGHGLFDAKEALRGLAQWFIMSKGKEPFKFYAPLQPGSLSEEDARKYLAKSNRGGRAWNVVHVLRFGFPAIEA